MSLRFLSRELFRLTSVPPIILIDDYDRPTSTAFWLGDQSYKSMKNFVNCFLTDALKNNPYKARTYSAGVSILPKDGIGSGLNNLKEHRLDSTTFTSYFGFTSEEVRSLLDNYYRINYPEPTNSDTTAFKEIIKNMKEESFS